MNREHLLSCHFLQNNETRSSYHFLQSSDPTDPYSQFSLSLPHIAVSRCSGNGVTADGQESLPEIIRAELHTHAYLYTYVYVHSGAKRKHFSE